MAAPVQRLVLLPGLDGTGELFAGLVNALGDRLTAKSVRYPSDESLSLVELAGLVVCGLPASEPLVIVAESFSTPVAIFCAAKHPTNLEGLVLCAGFAASPVHRWLRFLVLWGSRLWRASWTPDFAFRFLLTGTDAPQALIPQVRRAVSSVRPRVLSRRISAVLTCDVLKELSEVTVPILYIQAEQDRLVPPSCFDAIYRINPRTQRESIAGPHLLLQRKPLETARAIAAFVEHLE
jgi:pimeloyl-ACP methyl ester carboxylesterase